MNIPNHEIIDCLLNDGILNLKDKGGILREGTCPECSKKTVWIGKTQPWMLRCDREAKCGYTETIKERYPELFQNWQQRYPVTQTNPHATAQAYMQYKRGLDKPGFKALYTQGQHRLKNGTYAPTVKFDLCPGITWERLIEDNHIAIDGSGKTRIKKHNPQASYRGHYWMPAYQNLKAEDEVYVVEGIFCALSLISLGKKAVVAISSNNVPTKLLDDHKGKNITWVISFDNDAAGYKCINKCVAAFELAGEHTEVRLNEAGTDWNDAHLANTINETYLQQCIWRGRIFMAPTPVKRAYAMFGQTPFIRQVFDFNGRMYSAQFDSAEFSRAMEGMPFEYGECDDQFKKAITVICLSNCTIDFCYVEKDLFTEERLYAFKVQKMDEKRPTICRLSSAAINDAKALSTAILGSTNAASIDLSSADLKILHRRWLDRKTTMIEALQFIGFDEQTRSYVFPKFGYKNGRKHASEKEGYIKFGEQALRTNLKGVEFLEHDDYDGGQWINDFIKVFHYNGIATLAFFTASLFARQIKEAHQSLHFFELTGEPGAGKSTLIRFCWKLLGRDNYEGVDLLSASESAYGRHLSKLSNLPFVMIESDREGGKGKNVDWDMFKKIFDLDGVVDARGVKTNDNQTSERIFRGSLVISQNAQVQASQAMMERIVHMHCTTAHKTQSNMEIADTLKTMPVKALGGYLHHVIKNEKAYLELFFNAYAKHRAALLASDTPLRQRLVDCHAQLMAAVDALTMTIDGFTQGRADTVCEYISDIAHQRNARLASDHPVLQEFWDTYHYLNDDYVMIDDETGKRTANRHVLNHSKDSAFIAINLNHFVELCRLKGQKIPDLQTLKELLPSSRRYEFVKSKKVRSRIKSGAVVQCHIFEVGQQNEGI